METKTIIDAKKNNLLPNLRELVRYKDLFYTLAWRDFRVRYAQTTIGFLWAFIQPVVTLVILNIVFVSFAKVNTKPLPHILFTVSGLALWSYFSFVLTNSGNSIIANQGMVKKIYFPRLVIPLSKAVVGLIDFSIVLLIMIVFMIYYGYTPSSNIWAAPLFIIGGILAALSVGIWLSALTVRYRDFQHIVPFMVQIGMYATPVGYPVSEASSRFPDWAMSLYFLNPMAGVIEGFRWSVFGIGELSYLTFISFGMILLLFISGIIYFNKIESEMADYV